MKRLPAEARLLVEPKKIAEYLFNRNHPVGKSKAVFFLGNGYTQKDSKSFIAALKEHARTRPVVSQSSGTQGSKLAIECKMNFPDGKERCVRTVWIHQNDGQYRLVTSYPRRKIT